MNIRPILGDWEIPNIEAIDTSERRSFVEFEVPGRAGSVFHDLNTGPATIRIRGSLFGDERRDEFLQALRVPYRDGQPVTFAADILTATEVQYVVIEAMDLVQRSDAPDQLHYRFSLRESPPPPPPPDPFGALDSDLLDQAAGLVEAATSALDTIQTLGDVPDFGDPTEGVRSALDVVRGAAGGLDAAADLLGGLFED